MEKRVQGVGEDVLLEYIGKCFAEKKPPVLQENSPYVAT